MSAQTLPEYGRGATSAQRRELEEQISRLAKQYRVSEDTLRSIAIAIGDRSPGIDPRRLVERVATQAADVVKLNQLVAELRSQLVRLDDPKLRDPGLGMLDRAQRAIEKGRLDDADRELASLEYLRGSQLETSQTAWTDAVRARADVARLSQDYDRATDLLLEADRREGARRQTSARRSWRLRMDAANSQLEKGTWLGVNAALLRALTLSRDEALPLVSREAFPLDWAETQFAVGSAQLALGKRENGATRLEQAVDSYELALEEFTRERAPLQWAGTQRARGSALESLGVREGGTRRLEQAVSAQKLALQELTREHAPLEWAATQSTLGTTLRFLGDRETASTHLEEAVTAYRLALEEQPRERVPVSWATTQIGLGAALALLGHRETGTVRLQEALGAFSLALEEQSRERVPMVWAATQVSFANVLLMLGQREKDTARLEKADEAYRLVLDLYSRERTPMEWAIVQVGLAHTLWNLGHLEGDVERLEQSAEMYRCALEVYNRKDVPFQWIRTQISLDGVLSLIAAMRRDTRSLARTKDHLRSIRAEAARTGDELGVVFADQQLSRLTQELEPYARRR